MDQSLAKAEVVFGIEPLMVAYAEAGDLMQLHYEEIARNKQLLKLNPDMEKYQRIKDNVLLVTARSDGRLIGYFLWLMFNHAHYKDVLVAEEDLHYLLPEYRRGLTGYKFIKIACQIAFDHGADIISVREKIGHEHPAMMKRLGLVPTDITYTLARKK